MNFIDPYKLDQFPYIVFSDHSSGLIEWLIKMRTNGRVNHGMWAIGTDQFASQGNTYSISNFKRYMRKGNRLIFIKVTGLYRGQELLIIESINRKLALPWWRKRYDFLGILGQAIGVQKLNVPWLTFCTEDVPQHLKSIQKHLTQEQENIRQAFQTLPLHASPENLLMYMEEHKDVFEEVGRWEN